MSCDPAKYFHEFDRLVDSVSGICQIGTGILNPITEIAEAYFPGSEILGQRFEDIVSKLSIYLADYE